MITSTLLPVEAHAGPSGPKLVPQKLNRHHAGARTCSCNKCTIISIRVMLLPLLIWMCPPGLSFSKVPCSEPERSLELVSLQIRDISYFNGNTRVPPEMFTKFLILSLMLFFLMLASLISPNSTPQLLHLLNGSASLHL